jgi:ABC-2 type transport system permease protein
VNRLVRAELLKVRTTRLWIGLLIGGVALDAVGVIATLALAGTPEGDRANIPRIATVADVQTLVWSGMVLWLFVAVLTATISTGEYRYGTAAGTYLATPSRGRVLASKIGAAIPIGALAGIIGGGLPLVIAAVWFAVKGDALPFGAPVLIAVLEVALQCSYAAILAVCVGAAIRSQVVTILSVLGFGLVVEPLATALLPSLRRWAPIGGAMGAFGPPDALVFGHLAGFGLMLSYIVAVAYVAYWIERRRDV